MTEAEDTLWQHLRGNRLEGLHFRRQQVVYGFIADFYCHSAHVIIEVDGGIHKKQAEYDTERDIVLRARDFHIIRITNDDVLRNAQVVLDRIVVECKEHGGI